MELNIRKKFKIEIYERWEWFKSFNGNEPSAGILLIYSLPSETGDDRVLVLSANPSISRKANLVRS